MSKVITKVAVEAVKPVKPVKVKPVKVKAVKVEAVKVKAVKVEAVKVKGKGDKAKPKKHGSRGTPIADTLRQRATALELKFAKKPAQGVVVTTEGKGKPTRATVDGYSVVSFVRWCGYQGWSKARTVMALAKLGIATRDNCINAQLGDGKRAKAGEATYYGQPAEVDSVTAKRWAGFASEPK